MTHGVHAVQHEVEHEIKHGDQDGGHTNLLNNINKKVALLIGVLALLLAFSETLGKSAQTGAISYNIEAANLWAFFQAKNIRRRAHSARKWSSTPIAASITRPRLSRSATRWVSASKRRP